LIKTIQKGGSEAPAKRKKKIEIGRDEIPPTDMKTADSGGGGIVSGKRKGPSSIHTLGPRKGKHHMERKNGPSIKRIREGA